MIRFLSNAGGEEETWLPAGTAFKARYSSKPFFTVCATQSSRGLSSRWQHLIMEPAWKLHLLSAHMCWSQSLKPVHMVTRQVCVLFAVETAGRYLGDRLQSQYIKNT